MQPSKQRPEDRVAVARLVAAAKAGDARAFEQLIDRYRPGIRALCFDRTKDFDLAEDLAQDAVVRAHEHLHQLRENEAFPTWLRTIALNRCKAWQERPWPKTVPLDAEKHPELEGDAFREAMRREAAREVWAAVARLPENNRLALLMYYIRGDSYREIAEFLGVPETTVVGRLHRARGQLRSLLEERRIEEYLADFGD
jgi:RNA polymerase sigma-70 factor (ECF subfamily)